MSANLVQLADAHRAPGAPTVVELLSAAVRDRGALTDDDIRAAAAATGLPEATVHGVATFYDDLLAPRGARHVRVCTGTACFAATGGAHEAHVAGGLGVAPGACAADGSVSLAETVCLGFCHAAPAVRDGDVVDAGPGVVERVLAGTTRQATEPPVRSLLAEPVLTVEGDWSGLRRALTTLTPDALVAQVDAADLRGRGGAWFPAGRKWAFARGTPPGERYVVANGDEGDPGSYIDKHLMERAPALVLEGMALTGYAIGASAGFVLVRSEYPASRPALEAAIDEARAAGLLGEDILGSGFAFDVHVVDGAGSYVVGEETALLACLHGLRGTVSARPPFPATRGLYGRPTVVHNIETLANVPVIAARGAEAYRGLSPASPNAGTKLICLNERFATPGVVEVPFGITVRALCEDAGGGLVGGHTVKAVQIGGPLGGILPAALLDTPLDTAPLAEHGCMVGHGSIVAFDETTDMRALASHLLAFGAHESCGTCFPCRIGLQRAHEEFASGAAVDRGRLETLLETLEVASLCAHGGGMPAPIRSLLTHFPDELGLR
ncbi:MAG TPA: NAD(P)H-dependent oxidoreductase subunit E [Solirubrobacteraceae bacterium]|nr:NAD(P)H-dependent oxidoreductase subunit E [Solirubrobacteraceae bacterium]